MGLGKISDIKQDFNSHAHVERDFIARIKIYSVTISTHTLTWSVTHKHVAFVTNCSISTHTLTWSVTGSDLSSFQLYMYFNSHAHVERDLYILDVICKF